MVAGTRGLYGRILLYLVGVNVVLVASVAALHELGHGAVAAAADCRDVTIILFDTSIAATYAQMRCPEPLSAGLLFLSGFTFLIPLSVIFFLLGWLKERYIGHMILGMSIVFAATDIELLTDAPGLTPLIGLIGLIITVYGEDRLIHGILATEGRPAPQTN